MGDGGSGHGKPSRVAIRASDDIVSRLCRLALLRDRDALTEEEFQRARARLVVEWQTRGHPGHTDTAEDR